jgi:hypothetical protein
VLSDSRQENVYIFSRSQDYSVGFRKPPIETFGTSIGILLEEAFNKDSTIADLSNEFIENLKLEKIENLEDIKKIRKELHLVGESIEKLFLVNILVNKEKELQNK